MEHCLHLMACHKTANTLELLQSCTKPSILCYPLQVVDPWGCVVAECSDKVGLCMAEIDLTYLKRRQTEMPVQDHRRHDLYGHIELHQPGGGNGCGWRMKARSLLSTLRHEPWFCRQHFQMFWVFLNKWFVFWLKFHWSLSPGVQWTIGQDRSRKWLGVKLVTTSDFLNQCWPISLMPYGSLGHFHMHLSEKLNHVSKRGHRCLLWVWNLTDILAFLVAMLCKIYY